MNKCKTTIIGIGCLLSGICLGMFGTFIAQNGKDMRRFESLIEDRSLLLKRMKRRVAEGVMIEEGESLVLRHDTYDKTVILEKLSEGEVVDTKPVESDFEMEMLHVLDREIAELAKRLCYVNPTMVVC